MSLIRLVYYSALIAGWAALAGWFVCETLFFRSESSAGTTVVAGMVAGIVGGMIGLGLNVVAGMSNAQWKQLVRRAAPGLLGGCVGGATGGMIGNLLYGWMSGAIESPSADARSPDGFLLLALARAVGWLIMGMGIGVIEGIYEQSKSKIRNGLIGGGMGGFLGGFLFDIVGQSIGTQSGMSSRAIGFVILGVCIGALIGLAQVVLKDAWLTVLDGYRSGRQLILSQTVTVLGRAEHLALPFIGPMNKDLDLEHLRIIRQANGSYAVEDNHTKLGTRVNQQQVQGQIVLKDGDVLKFGTNFVRFNERHRRRGEQAAPLAPAPIQVRRAPPPPTLKKRAAATGAPPVPVPPPLQGTGAPVVPPAAPPLPLPSSMPITPPPVVAPPVVALPAAAPRPAAPGVSAAGGINAPPPPRHPKSS